MANPLISIIIPVYNVEAYLRQCLDSILMQEMTDWEAILVDDGSPDGSGAICDEYAAGDPRIKVFHKANGGVSSARNLGLEVAKGEWIVFVDSDDKIEKGFLEIEDVSADIIQKGYDNIDADGNLLGKHDIVSNVEFNKEIDILYMFVNYRNNALWDKLISRGIIGDLRFNEKVKIGEDFLFFLSLIPKVKKYVFSPQGKYLYRRLPNSAMSQINKDVANRLKVIEENVENIIACNQILNNNSLIFSLLFQGYFPYYFFYRDILTNTQNEQYQYIISKFSFKNIKYLNTTNKIKTTLKVFLSYIHK